MQSRIHISVTKHKLKIKELPRYHPSLTEDIDRLSNQLQKYIDIVFPEFNSLFKLKYFRPYMTLLKEFDNAHLTHLKNIVSIDSKERTINLDASHIKNIARNSIAENNDVITLKIKMLIESIKLIEN